MQARMLENGYVEVFCRGSLCRGVFSPAGEPRHGDLTYNRDAWMIGQAVARSLEKLLQGETVEIVIAREGKR